MRLKHEAPWRRRSKSLLPHHWALKGLRLQAFNMCQLGFVFHADCGGYGVMGSETLALEVRLACSGAMPAARPSQLCLASSLP